VNVKLVKVDRKIYKKELFFKYYWWRNKTFSWNFIHRCKLYSLSSI